MLNFNEQKSQFENLNLDQFRQNINTYGFSKLAIQIFWWLETWILRIIQMLCAITMMCYLLLPMQLVPLQECIKLNFSKILSSLFEIFLEKKIIKRKKLCKTLFWKKIQWTQWYLLWKLFQHIAKRWLSLTWLDLVFRPSAPYFIKNAYIQILSMHEKKKVKKKSIKTHHQYAEKNVPLCMLY